MAFHIPRPKPWWTPRYVINRVRWMFWQKRHPDKPWLTPAYVRFIEQWLSPRDVLVEFGSGRSTAWFASHVAQVISVEHNPQWHRIVQQRITQRIVRDGSWKLVPNGFDFDEIYNLPDDPHKLHNLTPFPEYRSQSHRMMVPAGQSRHPLSCVWRPSGPGAVGWGC